MEPRRVMIDFKRSFGILPEVVVRAPGRVNLIGEHLDYNGGCVLPLAIAPQLILAARRRSDSKVRLRSRQFREGYDGPAPPHSVASPSWVNYVLGVIALLPAPGGLDIAIDSEIPPASGLSSSAALEVATALAAREVWGLKLSGMDLALLCQRAENEFVGMRCGLMDQAAVACCHAGEAMLLDCSKLTTRGVPLQPQVAVVIAHSGVYRGLLTSEYNARRQDCEAALQGLNAATNAQRTSLCEFSPQDVPAAGMPERLTRRARHVVTENQRVLQTVRALTDGRVAEAGRLLNESHASLRDDFEVSCTELDDLAHMCRTFDGCHGARLTGAGFGGCVVSLVAAERGDDLIRHLERFYYAPRALTAMAFVTAAAAGASVVARSMG